MQRQRSRFSIISPVEHTSSTSTYDSITEEKTNPKSYLCTDTTATIESRIIESFIVVWLCSNINDFIIERDYLTIELRHIISAFHVFTEKDECMDFVTDTFDEKVVMIFNDYPDQNFLSLIDLIPQLDSVYIFHTCQEKCEQRTKDFSIVKGTFREIAHLCSAIRKVAYRLVVDLTPISIVPPSCSPNLDELDQSFMYTQLLKEIIIDIEYDPEKSREEFTQFCVSRSAVDGFQLNAISQFQRCYEQHPSIWWYTKEWFLYSSLNKALRTQDVEMIMKMGFFVQDLHREIKQQHSKIHDTSKIVVYRGQALSNDYFEKLRKSKGGLLSFNNFLSTSVDRDVSFTFADSNQQNYGMTAVLFKMEIDPSIKSTPFARIENIGQFKSEEEILFSMHTIFRIGDMKQMDDRLWEVNLTLTADNDEQLKYLTECIRNEIGGGIEWSRMAMLMFKMGKYNKFFEILKIIPEIVSKGDVETRDAVQTIMSNHMGLAQDALGNYSAALANYKNLLQMFQEFSGCDHSYTSTLYSNIGKTYQSMGDFSSALLNFEKALEIEQQSSSPNSIALATIYNNIAITHQSVDSFSSALSYLEKSLEISQQVLPPSHPALATIHKNIGFVNIRISNYPNALFHMEKSLQIDRKSLPSNHPDLALSHNNIGKVHELIGNYATALSYFEKTLEIQQNSLPSDHPHMAITHSNIASIYYSMHSFRSALSYLKNSLEIQNKFLPPFHPDLAMTHCNIGAVHHATGDYSNALSYCDKALEMLQKTLPSNHSSFAATYYILGSTHQSLGNYSTAQSYYDKALEIQQNSLPSHHPDLIRTYHSIALLSLLRQDFVSTVSSVEKVAENHQKLLSVNPLSSTVDCSKVDEMTKANSEMFSNLKKFSETYQRLGLSDASNFTVTDDNIDEVTEFALSYLAMIPSMEKALELQKESPLSIHPSITSTQIDRTDNDHMVENCLTTLSHSKKHLQILQKSLSFADENSNYGDDNTDEIPFLTDELSASISPLHNVFEIMQKYSAPNDMSLSTHYNTIGESYYSIEDYNNALLSFEKALDNLQKCSPINQQILAKTHNNIAKALDGLSRHREAVDHAKQALEIARSISGSNHPETDAYRNHFDQLRRKL